MLKNVCHALIAVAVAGFVSSANASPVTFNIVGTVQSSSTLPGYANGQTVTAQVSFDLNQATTSGGANFFDYHISLVEYLTTMNPSLPDKHWTVSADAIFLKRIEFGSGRVIIRGNIVGIVHTSRMKFVQER